MSPRRIFDQNHYQTLNPAQEAVLLQLLPDLRTQFAMRTAVDVGCGVGHFSNVLHEQGFDVLGIDARQENVAEAQRRFPAISFRAGDVEDPNLAQLGRFDLVLCFGLLYHLENPFRAIRNLLALTGKTMVISTQCIPAQEPVMLLRNEGPTEDQGLNHIAFYPSEASLVNMLYATGFARVYRLAMMPAHPHFHATWATHQMRTMLVAAHERIESALLVAVPAQRESPDPWATSWAGISNLIDRLRGFVVKPWPEKKMTIGRLVRRS